jgi:hypothetical protein
MADRAVRGAIVVGVWIALSTEVLGTFGLLSAWPLGAAWLLFIACAILRRGTFRFEIPRLGAFEIVALGSVAIILGTLLVIALRSPPNSADAMAYHMPRVLYWAQARNVSFFPTPYLNQVSLQPLAEYFILHSFVLSGGDRFANLVQWFGFAGCVVMAPLIAGQLGAGRRGKVLAALFATTVPNAILQATGAKNDLLMAFWLAAMTYFLLRDEIGWSSWGLALAVFTKATAYLFAPGLIIAALVWKSANVRSFEVAVAAVLLINGPLYVRNFALTGFALGHDSAQGDGVYRWGNSEVGLKPTVSNALRHLNDQLGGRSASWNQWVYGAAIWGHRIIGADPQDARTTFPGAHFEPPLNANHEANGNSRWHLLLIALCLWDRKRFRYAAGLAVAFVLFCVYLKWQMFMGRMLTPLFLLAAPLVGVVGERVRPAFLQAVGCLFLLSVARLPVTNNWVRPLAAAGSREDGYFNDMKQWNNAASYRAAVDLLANSGCNRVGVDINHLQLEYPLEALLRARRPGAEFVHVGVTNASARLGRGSSTPCAVVCLDCVGVPAKEAEYAGSGTRREAGKFLIFVKP